jgi:hypothetical protein
MAHSPVAWEHVTFKDVVIKVSNVDVYYKAIRFYLQVCGGGERFKSMAVKGEGWVRRGRLSPAGVLVSTSSILVCVLGGGTKVSNVGV